ncbi:MAG: peptide chain release factor-like protein [Planctomycetes bacterium]|nr:peptide chain release factor-like protein [Planctomycetota bacterium]
MNACRSADSPIPPPNQALRERVGYADPALLSECAVHTYRASGPGGQKRNKTSSAVRLHHHPSGLIAKATESRSQHENKARALRRLREMLAISVRLPPPDEIAWPNGVQIVGHRLAVGPKNPAINLVIGLVLDVFASHGGRLAETAKQLGVTSSSLQRFLLEHTKAWAEVNRLREAAGLPPLRS